MDHKSVNKFLLGFPNTWIDYPFGKEVAVYKFGPKPDPNEESKMFALISVGKTPVRLSLKCDPLLAKHLREKYDEVMPGFQLNKKYWITVVLSGQLTWEEIQGLIRLSYDLVAEPVV